MAIEDAVVLGSLLSRISRRSQLRPLLQAYQDLRLDRTAMAQQVSRRFQHIFHLPDGPEQRERDENLRRTIDSEVSGNSKLSPDSSQNRGTDADANDVFFRYDADAEADKWWVEESLRLRRLRVRVQHCKVGGDFHGRYSGVYLPPYINSSQMPKCEQNIL